MFLKVQSVNIIGSDVMGIVYHGSSEHRIKRLEPQKSTHGVYVYATPEKVLALNFSGRCGDDLTYDIGHFGIDKNGPWELVEIIPGAFDKMFSNSSSIYSLSDETFKDIDTGFKEVVSEVGVDIIDEEYCENVYEGLLKAEREGLVKIYRYPNKPVGMKADGSDVLDKWRHYKNDMGREFGKYNFDRLLYLHPSLIEQINELAREFDLDFQYEPRDLIELFRYRILRQLYDMDHEQYVDSSYISICNAFPNFKSEIDVIYEEYINSIKKNDEESHKCR